MEIIITPRRTGSLTRLITRANSHNLLIVLQEARIAQVKEICNKTGQKLPEMITFQQFIKKDYKSDSMIVIHRLNNLIELMSDNKVISATIIAETKTM